MSVSDDNKIINPVTGYKIKISGETARKLYKQYMQGGVKFNNEKDLKLLESQFNDNWKKKNEIRPTNTSESPTKDKLPQIPDDVLKIIFDSKNFKTFKERSRLKGVNKEFNEKFSSKDIKTEFTWTHDFDKFVNSLNPNITPMQMNAEKYDELRRQFYLILVYNLNLSRNSGINDGVEDNLEDLIANEINEKDLMLELKKHDSKQLRQWCVYEIIFLMFTKDSYYESGSDDSDDSDENDSSKQMFNEKYAFRLAFISLQSNLGWAELTKKYEKHLDIALSLSPKNKIIEIKKTLDKLPILILLLMSHYFEN
jgi:hypothetical protein